MQSKQKSNHRKRSRNARATRENQNIRRRIEYQATNNFSVQESINRTQQSNMYERLDRIKKSQVRNKVAQSQILQLTPNQDENETIRGHFNIDEERNQNERKFFDTINAPLCFICASCGELSQSDNIKVIIYKNDDTFFFPLITTVGNGLIEEAVVIDNEGNKKIPLCKPCFNALKNGDTPKFSQAAGFTLSKIPDELATLNDLEARMIGIGVCFTTCFRLRGGGQLGTTGNSISYWNQTCPIIKKLPRPVSKCGVVYLRTSGERMGVSQVRPNYIRAALYWLIKNNNLYKSIQIDEELLQQLEDAHTLPEIVIEENDVETDTITQGCEDNITASTNSVTSSNPTNLNILDGRFIESFEMPIGDCDNQTENERVLSILQNQCQSTAQPVSIPALNVTINEYTSKYLMQHCFATLFPDGLGGLNPLEGEKRLYHYHLAEYFGHLMLWHDRRFVMHPTFKFFALNFVQRRQVDGLTKKASKGHNIQNHQTNSSHNKENDIKQLLRELKPYFKSVRGTGLYWNQIRSELMCMLGSDTLPVRWPTFFFTLSAADTVWPDFFKACNPALSLEDASKLSQLERYRYLNDYPDIAVRHFYRRYKSFFTNIIKGSHEPVGKVVDYFWRVEFQKRGSPHIHGLLWIEGAPDVRELSKTEVGRTQLASFVDKYVHAQTMSMGDLEHCTCVMCSEKDFNDTTDILTRKPPTGTLDRQCDLRRVVNRVQQHVCFPTSSCHQKRGTCRFKYPKKLRNVTTIDVKQITEKVEKITVHYKRNNPFINPFNPDFILPWRSNMDIKLIGNAHGVAEYTAAYVSKAEPDTSRFRAAIQKALDRCPNNSDSYSTLRRVANAIIAVREISAQEAMWILLPGLCMTEKSRSVVKVKTLRHSKRSQWISPEECIQALQGDSGLHANNPKKLDALESLYASRPRTELFNTMSYKYFVEHFEASRQHPNKGQKLERYKRTDGNGYIKDKVHPQIILKCPFIKPNISDPDYCFQELLLNLPWRNLNDLATDDNECILKFNTLCSSRIYATTTIEDVIDRMDAQNLLHSEQLLLDSDHFVDENDTFVLANNDIEHLETNLAYNPSNPTNCTIDEYNNAEKFISDVVSTFTGSHQQEYPNLSQYPPYMYPIGLDRFNMNEDQWNAFGICMNQSRERYKSFVRNKRCKQMQLILNGEGGSGKSWLIDHIVKDTYQVFDGYPTSNTLRVLLLAHQGTAAFNIHGTTICSSFAIPRSFAHNYVSLTSSAKSLQTLKRLQEKYEHIHLVIIDEFSVISCTLLSWIDQRLREIFPQYKDDPFGGRDVILAGDIGQLSPVKANSLSTHEDNLYTKTDKDGRNAWININLVSNLYSQNRGIEDVEWYDALRRLRRMEENANDIALFNTRVKSLSLQPQWIHNATHIAYTNKSVNETNDRCIAQQPNEVFTFHSNYTYTEKDPLTPLPCTQQMIQDAYATMAQPDSKRDAVIQHKVQLAKGAPVALTYNAAQSAGLCNGTHGIIYDFMFCKEKQLPIVLVQIIDRYKGPSFLDIPNIIPIAPKSINYSVKNNNLRVTRIGIPLRLAYSTTIHKVQGLTCSKVVFNPDSIPSSAFAYVALSRVRRRHDIILTEPLTINKTPSQSKEKAKLHKECARLEEKARKTITENHLVVSAMREKALEHNNYM